VFYTWKFADYFVYYNKGHELRNSNFYRMINAFFVTVQHNNDQTSKHIISPEFKDIEDAAIFLDEVINQISREGTVFEMVGEEGLEYRNEDIIFHVEMEDSYDSIPLERFDVDVFDTCFKQLQDFLDAELVGQE